MAISSVTKKYGVTDAKAYLMTADPAGGSATYGSAIDIVGIKSITLSGTADVKSLRGDNTLLDEMSSFSSITGTLNFAKVNLALAAALTGNTVAAAGSGSTETNTFVLNSNDTPAPVKIEAKTDFTDLVGGDIHLVLHKVVVTGIPISGFAEEDYQTESLEFRVVPLISTGDWLTIVQNETAVAIT